MKSDTNQLSVWDLVGCGGLMSTAIRSAPNLWDYEFPITKIHESPEGFLLMVVVPGYEEDDLEVFFENRELRVSGWRVVPSEDVVIEPLFSRNPEEEEFRKVFRFLVPVQADGWRTRFEDGVLLVWLPKVGEEMFELDEMER